ncbi:hypothetical protein LCGC14_2990360, partial [marine sediment metagenome]
FLDPYKFLAQHAIMRLQIYVKMGCYDERRIEWMVQLRK